MSLSADVGAASCRLVRALAGLVVVAAVGLSAVSSAHAAQGYVSSFSFSGGGADPGLLSSPQRVAVEPSSGNVFVADQGNGRVQVFDPAGSFLTEFGSGELDAPFGVAVRDVLGETVVYVSDPATNRIVRYESDELLVPSFAVDPSWTSPTAGTAAGKIGSFRSPLAVDSVSGDLLVADTGKQLVQRYTPTGAFVSDFDGSGSPDGGFSHLEDLAVSPAGDVYVVDAQGGSAADGSPSRVDRFTAAGGHVSNVRPLQGEGDGLVAFDPHTQHLLVGDVRGFSSRLHVIDTTTNERVTGIGVGAVKLAGLAFDAGASERLYAVTDDPFCGGDCGPVAVQAFEANALPDASVAAATDVTATSATLHGSVDPNGSPTTARFELSTDGGGSWSSAGDVDPAPGDGTDPVQVTLTAGVSHSTSYQVRLVASNPGGGETVSSNTESFTTDAIDPPDVTLDPPTDVTTDSATISGTVDPNGAQAYYRFETSTNGSDWTQIDPDQDGDEDAGANTDPVQVSQTLANLEPATTYQIRLIAHNPGGETTQDGQQLTTDSVGPTAITHLVANLRHDSVRLTGFTDPNNQPTTYHFEWGRQSDLSDAQTLPAGAHADAGSGSEQTPVGQNLTGLTPETTYHYRLITDNPTGPPTQGDIYSFRTRATPPPAGEGVGAWGDRAIELVSTTDTNGNQVTGGPEISTDGKRVAYDVRSSADGNSPTGSSYNAVVSDRTESGWKTGRGMPPRTVFDHDAVFRVAANEDLTLFGYVGIPPISSAFGDRSLGRFSPDSGEFWQGMTFPAVPGVPNSVAINLHAFSRDLSRVLIQRWEGQLGFSPVHLHDVTDAQSEMISLLPGDITPPCGMTEYAYNTNSHAAQNWLSRDGGLAVFASRGDNCSGPSQLYVRHAGPDGSMAAGSGHTTLISGPVVSGPDHDEKFIRVTDDGKQVFFATQARLAGDDLNDGIDVYRYIFGEGNACITCAVDNADVDTGAYPGAPTGTDRVLVSPDGSRAYFTSRRALAPGATPSAVNLYVWRAARPDRISYVAGVEDLATDAHNGNGFTVYGLRASATTNRDGSMLVFTSPDVRLDGVTGMPNDGFRQLYRYSDVERSLECISCPSTGATGSAELGPDSSFYVGGSELRDSVPVPVAGDRFAFSTAQALVASDLNSDEDLYEWREGRVGLITSGRGARETGQRGLDISSDGKTIVFKGWLDELAPGVRGRTAQVYAARIDGGFELSPTTPCIGDACQGVAATNRGGHGADNPGSLLLRGGGDLSGGRSGFELARVGAGQLSALAAGRRGVLRVRVGGPGRVSVRGRARLRGRSVRVLAASKRASRAGTVVIGLRLSRVARRELARRGRLRISLLVRFSSVPGERSRRVLVLRRGR